MGQDSHAALDLQPVVGLKPPAGQACQTRRDAAPASSQKPPFGQSSQAGLPTAEELQDVAAAELATVASPDVGSGKLAVLEAQVHGTEAPEEGNP